MSISNDSSRARLRPDQIFFLSLLAFLTSGTTFLMHHSRQVVNGDQGLYSAATSVLLAEALKLAISVFGIYCGKTKNDSEFHTYTLLPKSSVEYDERDVEKVDYDDSDYYQEKEKMSPILSSPLESRWLSITNEILSPNCWKMGLPAVLYVIQNTLQLYATGTVSPILYQALTQLKIIAATVLSMWLLKRNFSLGQWLSLVILLVGVILVSVSKMNSIAVQVVDASISNEENGNMGLILAMTQAEMLAQVGGIFCVILACTFGSAAAVYVELKVKSEASVSLWVRNAQLALFSLVPAIAGVIYDAYTQGEWSPMRYFGFWAWLTVLVRTLSGFLVAIVLKYTDSILKGERSIVKRWCV